MNIFTKYYRFEYNIVDKTTKTILRTQTITVKRFWLQDVINDGFIELCKEQLKDYECLSIKSVTRSSSVEFMEFKDCTIKETNERRNA